MVYTYRCLWKDFLRLFYSYWAFCYLAGGSGIEMQDFSGLSQAVQSLRYGRLLRRRANKPDGSSEISQ